MVLLDVQGPWHSPFLGGTIDAFRSLVESAKFNLNDKTVLSNINGRRITSVEELRLDLVNHYCSTIDWELTTKGLLKQGVERVNETCHSNMLRSFSIFIDRKLKYS